LDVLVLYAFALCNPENGEEHFKVENSAVKTAAVVFWKLEVFGQQEDETKPPPL
jgi:hypothetical protein